MTKKELARATYVNKSKKARKEEASEGRKDWTGFRSTVYADKTKYNRKKMKKELDKEARLCYN